MTTKGKIAGDEISLKELLEKGREWFDYLLLQWKIIVLAGLIGAVIGLTYSFIRKPIYTATLSFALEDEEQGGGISGALGLASSLGFNFGGSGGSIFADSNLAELFKSRKMIEETLLMPVVMDNKTISFAEMYIQNNEWRDNWEDKPEFKNIQFLPNSNRRYFTRVHDSIFGVIYEDLIKNSLNVGKRDKKVDIISMDVSSTNELFSKFFCEALARQVGEFYVATKTKKSRENMAILQKQTDSIRSELDGSIYGVAVANDNVFNLNPSLNVRRVPSTRRQVDVQANVAILTELVKQSELAKITVRRNTPLIQVIDRPVFPLKKDKVGKLKGIVFGGILAGFFISVFLLIRKY